MNPPVPHRAKGNLLLLFYANDGYCCSCYIHTYSAFPRFPESATTVKATSPIFQIDFYFAAKVIKSLQPAPPARRGNQLSLVNEMNNDSIIFIYTKLFTESALHTAWDMVLLSWFKSHFFDIQNHVAVRFQIW